MKKEGMGVVVTIAVFACLFLCTPALAMEKPDLTITAINAYHYNPGSRAWFDLSNEVDVTLKNNGTVGAEAFNVSLYADGDLIGKRMVSGLGVGEMTTVQFTWTPVGDDCFDECSFIGSSRVYNLKAIADCDFAINESDETNNERVVEERVCYNGYMADEPLETVAHGKLHGGLLFMTGDGSYGGLYYPGSYRNTTYEITLPAGATVKLARLNVYYTWQYATSCPEMEVSITYDGNTYVLPVDKKYNDLKCGEPWNFPWGNYVFNLTDYIQGSGTYTVTVKRSGGPSFCIAAPGIEVLYKDKNKPLIEYWINEGADLLLGGHRSDGGYLSLEECITPATFEGGERIDLSKVKNATLAVVSPWAGSAWVPDTTNHLYFNGVELGQAVYHGYDETYSKTMDGITMHIGSTNAQVGVNVSEVTSYLKASDNVVGQGDDGDCMMPANAFLVITYPDEEKEVEGVSISTDKYEYTAGETMLINLTLTNPRDTWLPAHFLWRLDFPDYDMHYLITKKEIYLLPESVKTITIPTELPKWRVSFNATWYVTLLNTTIPEIISEDTADWRYVSEAGMGKSERMPEAKAEEIAKEMSKTVRVEAFFCGKEVKK